MTVDQLMKFSEKELFDQLNKERQRIGRNKIPQWQGTKDALAQALKTAMEFSLPPTKPSRNVVPFVPKAPVPVKRQLTPVPKPQLPKPARPHQGRGGRRKFSDQAIITVVNLRKPKQHTKRDPYSIYKTGMTVADAVEKGVKLRDINYDEWAGHISVSEPEVKKNGNSVK
ncbi:hypothetical protein EHM76_04415 [bacterium]|nr:MAG: hypothetical protein EHM76_04415 [bacterium]